MNTNDPAKRQKASAIRAAICRGRLFFLLTAIGALPATATTYTVTTVSDNASGTNPAAGAGTGTLRQAIIDANNNAGADIISFNIAGAGVKTLTLLAELPIMTSPVAINGYSQSGAAQGAIGSRTILIQVDGNSQTAGGGRSGSDGANGLFRFTGGASGSSLSGLSIYNTGESVEAVEIEPGASNMHIWGNYIGVLANGSSPATSADYNGDDGVMLGAFAQTTGSFSDIFIGTDGNNVNDANEGNVVANSAGSTGGDGISVGISSSVTYTYSNIRICGNYIGVAADGITPAPNGIATTVMVTQGADGINLLNAANVLIGSNGDGISDTEERNIISGNYGHGIDVTGGSNFRIGGNYIGTDKNGLVAVPNGKNTSPGGALDGIFFSNNVSNMVIGFDDATHTAAVAPAVRNIISGNYGIGIQVFNNTAGTNRISGNYIGVNVTGNAMLGNGQGNIPVNQNLFVIGIDVVSNSNLLIGTDADGNNDALERNIIGGQVLGRGIYLRGGSTGNIIAGNYIGLGANGTTATGNETSGILIDASNNNRIGSNDDGSNDATEANIIANNASTTAIVTSDGIRITGNATGNRISRNSFYSNRENPIDLSNDGVTVNDGTTTAGSPNLLLDYPVITSYAIAGSNMTVSGYIGQCNGSAEFTPGTTVAGNMTVQIYKVNDDGDQNGAITGNGCSRSAAHGEGAQYLGSIAVTGGTFTNSTFSLVSGATFATGDKLTAITIDASGNTSEFGAISQVQVSGNVFNDLNGLKDNTVNGAGTNAGTTLYAILYDNITGSVTSIATVPASGIFNLDATSGNNATVYVTTTPATVGQTAVPVITLPAGWTTTGENLGAGAGSDGAANSILTIGTVTATVTNANFGMEQPPTANTASAPSQTNPGGTVNVTIPPATFGGTDPAGGVIDSLVITAFPSNTTSITINGTTYTAGSPVWSSGGVRVPTTAAGQPTQTIAVDPVNGGVTVSIPYRTVDNAGKQSTAPGSASITFTTPLPVQLKDFTAVLQKDDVQVQWVTATALPGTRYELLHSGNGNDWALLATVNDLQQQGEQQYNYRHLHPGVGDHYYRLKLVDGGQSVSYSKTVLVRIAGKEAAITVYPNPANGRVTVVVGRGDDSYDVQLADLAGRILQVQEQVAAGTQIQLDISQYPMGMYFIRIAAHPTGQVSDQVKLIRQ